MEDGKQISMRKLFCVPLLLLFLSYGDEVCKESRCIFIYGGWQMFKYKWI